MVLFDEKGCLTDQALDALNQGSLDELNRLEAAEHLAYCDHCMDRYTLMLSWQELETPPKPLGKAVRQSLWVRMMQSRLGRGVVACAAGVLAIGMWNGAETLLPLSSTATTPPERPSITAPAPRECWQDPPRARAPEAAARAAIEKLIDSIKTTGGFQL